MWRSIIGKRIGLVLEYLDQRDLIFSLTLIRTRSICSKVPSVSGYPFILQSWQNPDSFVLDQCLDLKSDMYRPDSIDTTVAAFITSNGDSAKLQIAWVVESDMYIGLKYVREGNLEASLLSLSSHQEITFDLHKFFNVSFVPGACRISSGSGMSY